MGEPRYLLICSAGHSGSTLLDLLLGSHSQVESLGEVSQLPKNIALNTPCSCGAPVRGCPLWAEVIGRLGRRQGVDLFATPYALTLDLPKATMVIDRAHQTPAYLLRRKVRLGFHYLNLRSGLPMPPQVKAFANASSEGNLALFEEVLRVSGARRVVDSSKSYLKAVELYRRRPDAVRLLLLVRDGRGVLHSHLKRGVSRRNALRGWRNYYRRSIPLLVQHVPAAHRLFVRYEDLVGEPDVALDGICKFLAISFEPQMLHFAEHVHHIANGNDMRFLRTSQIQPDTAWTSRLSDRDRRWFERRAGWLNEQLGYAA